VPRSRLRAEAGCAAGRGCRRSPGARRRRC